MNKKKINYISLESPDEAVALVYFSKHDLNLKPSSTTIPHPIHKLLQYAIINSPFIDAFHTTKVMQIKY